jgi:PAS domain-containing protein
VTAVSLVESADLRWYVGQLHLRWLANLAAAANAVFPKVRATGLETSAAYEFTLLEIFAAVQLTVAFLSRPLAVLLVRVNSRLEVSGRLLTEVQGLFHAVLRAEPDPSVIIYADSGQLVQASDSFFNRMLVRPSELAGKGLFEIVRFDEPDAVRAALSAPSGELPFCVYRIHGETRIANLYFYRAEHEATAYIYVEWQEVTELYYLQSAFDAVDDPLMIVASDSRLQYANRTARELFGDLYFGMDLATVAKARDVLDAQVDARDGEGDRSYLLIDGQPYDVHRLAVRLSGHSVAASIIWLHSVA